MGLAPGSNSSGIAGLTGPVSASDPACFDGDHDHIKCGSQKIVGKTDALPLIARNKKC